MWGRRQKTRSQFVKNFALAFCGMPKRQVALGQSASTRCDGLADSLTARRSGKTTTRL